VAEAAKQITTTWISPADAIAMIAKIYQSKTVAEEKIAIGLVTGRVHWDCLELIVIKKRGSDPGRGDPEFWRRLRKGAVNWPEAWARRCVVSYARNRRPITLCDYTAVGIVVAREDVLGLISPAVRMKLAEMEAARDAGQATCYRRRESAHRWRNLRSGRQADGGGSTGLSDDMWIRSGRSSGA
jgi:hypothetical protein